ncbi:MAG: TerB family tellurite resistance protein [Armatimonadota bacterium]
MFLHILNDQQQKAFLAVATQFIEADTHLADAEQNLLELMYAETGLPFETELPSGSVGDLLEPFDTKQARAAVLLELIGVGHADDDFHPEESRFVHDVAERLGFSDADVHAMEGWIQRQLQLAKDVEQFWAE